MTEADTDRSLQLALDQGHGTPIWRAAMLTNQYAFRALLPAVEMYQAFIDDSHDKLLAEFELLKQRWHAAAVPPETALDAYTARNASLYPNLSIMLHGSRHCHLGAFPFHSQTARHTFCRQWEMCGWHHWR